MIISAVLVCSVQTFRKYSKLFYNSSRFVYMGVLLFAIDKYHPLSIVIDDIYNFCNVFFTVRPGKEDSL